MVVTVDALGNSLEIGDVVMFVSKNTKTKKLNVGKVIAFHAEKVEVEGYNFYNRNSNGKKIRMPANLTGKFSPNEISMVAHNDLLKKYSALFLSRCYDEKMMEILLDEDYADYPGEWAEAALTIKYKMDDFS